MPAFADDTPTSRERFRQEWKEVRPPRFPATLYRRLGAVQRIVRHPEVAANASTQDFVSTIVADTRRLDPTRPIVDNSAGSMSTPTSPTLTTMSRPGRLFRAAWRKFQADPSREHAPVLEWMHQGKAVYGPQYAIRSLSRAGRTVANRSS